MSNVMDYLINIRDRVNKDSERCKDCQDEDLVEGLTCGELKDILEDRLELLMLVVELMEDLPKNE